MMPNFADFSVLHLDHHPQKRNQRFLLGIFAMAKAFTFFRTEKINKKTFILSFLLTQTNFEEE